MVYSRRPTGSGGEPGGAAKREFVQETGPRVAGCELLDVSEVILPARPYHSITITFSGAVVGGQIRPEPNHHHGEKTPRWLSREELGSLACHPRSAVDKAFDLYEVAHLPGVLDGKGR